MGHSTRSSIDLILYFWGPMAQLTTTPLGGHIFDCWNFVYFCLSKWGPCMNNEYLVSFLKLNKNLSTSQGPREVITVMVTASFCVFFWHENPMWTPNNQDVPLNIRPRKFSFSNHNSASQWRLHKKSNNTKLFRKIKTKPLQ